MSIQLLKKLPTPTEIKADYPVTQKVAQIKAERDEMIRKVFTGESDKFLVIIGPCSADNEEAVCEYINRLSRVQEEVAGSGRSEYSTIYISELSEDIQKNGRKNQ